MCQNLMFKGDVEMRPMPGLGWVCSTKPVFLFLTLFFFFFFFAYVIAQASLQLTVIPPQPPEYGDYKFELLYLLKTGLKKTSEIKASSYLVPGSLGSTRAKPVLAVPTLMVPSLLRCSRQESGSRDLLHQGWGQ